MNTMIRTSATTETPWVTGCTVMPSTRVRDLGGHGTAAHLRSGRRVAAVVPFFGSAAGFSAQTAADAIATTTSGTSAWRPPT